MRQIVPLLLLIIAILGSIFYTKPLYADIMKLRADRAQYNEALANAQLLDDRLTKLINDKNSFSSDDLARLRAMVPDNIDTVRLAIEINEIAKKYSSGIKSISLTNTADMQSASKKTSKAIANNAVTIGFSVGMSYDSFIDFTRDIESNLRIADVVGVSFTPDDTKFIYTFNVTIKTYWSK